MFEDLKGKSKKLFDKKNRNPLAKFFQHGGYTQDMEWRRVQVLFFKLLMIAATADDELDEQEINLIKDYAFENSLSEEEWREISYFETKKVSKEEIRNIVNEILTEIKSKRERVDIINAIKEIIESDDAVSPEEEKILNIIEEEMKNQGAGFLKSITGTFSSSLTRKKNQLFSGNESKEFTINPILPVLKDIMPGNSIDKDNINEISAVLGLAVCLIHADMELHDKEKTAFITLISKELGLSEEKSKEIAGRILDIPDTYFEIAYLGRIIAESADRERRQEILSSLFDIAYADQEYSPHEDSYLKIISKYLMIEHSTFISLKLKSKETPHK